MGALPFAEVLGTGMVTPVGLTAVASAAAIRAGISRLRETSLLDSHCEPVIAGLLEDQYLPEVDATLTKSMNGMTSRHRRIVLLAARALQEAAAKNHRPLPLMLALPEPSPWGDPIGQEFLRHLAVQSGVELDLSSSRALRHGRAGGLIAVRHALELLATRRFQQVLVGGADTYWDAHLLAQLDADERLMSRERLIDGFFPGEGAAFLLLGAPGNVTRGISLGRILGVGLGHERGHLRSAEPYLGEGLAESFQQLFMHLPASTPRTRCVYAGLNGESFWAKEWGVAYLRHSQHFEADTRIEHPAEYTGDLGAALGSVMLVLASVGLQRGYRQGPCIVWCSSDDAARAAVMLHKVAP